jgi:hypothetical protein
MLGGDNAGFNPILISYDPIAKYGS